MKRTAVESTVRTILCAGALAAGIFAAATSLALASGHVAHQARVIMPVTTRNAAHQWLQTVARSPRVAAPAERLAEPETLGDRSDAPGTTPFPDRPWIEGYEPAREDALFRAAYPVLPSHNVLKIYVSDVPVPGAAGVRFSGRVPHTQTDLTEDEMEREAATLIRTTFERFPDIQTIDVWATIPVDKRQLASVESTVFSVSADRTTYRNIRDLGLTDDAFLAAFGPIWIAPQVPQ